LEARHLYQGENLMELSFFVQMTISVLSLALCAAGALALVVRSSRQYRAKKVPVRIKR
jgi:hypothetical protein